MAMQNSVAHTLAQKRTIAAISTAVVSVAAWVILERYVYPLTDLKNYTLPPSWLGFSDGQAEIVMRNQLKYCEDVFLDHEEGVAIISCDPGRAQWNTVMGTMHNPNPKGTLYVYSYATKKDLKAIELIGFPPTADFHPLGINFFRDSKGGPTRLFVINHQRSGSTIDIFDLDYATLQATFVSSICDSDKNILSPNAISPTSYTTFYVTNDHRFIPRLHKTLNQIETMRALPLGWATYVDFAKGEPNFMTVASRIPFANGLVVTPTGKEVIIASTTAKQVLVYDRDATTNRLSLRERIPTMFSPDNINFDDSLDVNDKTAFDKDGRFLRGLVCGGHPSPRRIIAMSLDPVNQTAPSWIAEIRRGPGKDIAACSAVPAGWKGSYYMKSLYQSDGSHFPSSTTGAMDTKRRRLLVTGLYAQGILDVSWPENNVGNDLHMENKSNHLMDK